ncbi:proteasome subunit alpha type-2-like [Zingiber officinale]|uniref:proteasome subunit alpha type-2-like n=1 Tax=Zingiber officinale TaxID=94328 RepID=UPI001C4AC886|nr:proteasome subunit alpha type-2-like [Zingiber officinale]
MGDSQYSFSLTTFSPSGKLVQIEHALMAVGSGQTSLGIKAANGVVIATEKKLPSILVDEASVQKIQLMTTNIGVVYSGMGPDSRVLVRKSRKQAQQYFRLYKVSLNSDHHFIDNHFACKESLVVALNVFLLYMVAMQQFSSLRDKLNIQKHEILIYSCS